MGAICREYMGYRDPKGYGQRARGRWGTGQVHRQVWIMAFGPIPPGLVVMHTCDNPPCFLLAHLRLGTTTENQADMAAKGRGRPRLLPDDDPCSECGLPRSRRPDGRLRCLPCHARRRAESLAPSG